MFAFVTVVLTATAVVGRPKMIRSVDLAEAINKTVCPIRLEVDEDPDRIPRRIKMMRCGAEPNRWCKEQLIPHHECCQHVHADHQMACVEIHDSVLVYYKSTKETKIYEVAVGCSCMIEQSTHAPPVPNSPT